MAKITYYHTLYKREVTELVRNGEFEFKDGRVVFNSFGHGVAIEFEYVRKIELIED